MLNFEKIGERIHHQRKQVKHMSQEQFAEAMCWYQSDISNLEKAKSGSGITDLYKLDLIADFFEIPLQYLLFGEGDGKMMTQKETTMKPEHAKTIVDISPEALRKLEREIESVRHSVKGNVYRLDLMKEELEQRLHLLMQGDVTPLELEVLEGNLDYYQKASAFLDRDVKHIQEKVFAMREQFTDDIPDDFLRIYNRFLYDVMNHVMELDEAKLYIQTYEEFLKELLENREA